MVAEKLLDKSRQPVVTEVITVVVLTVLIVTVLLAMLVLAVVVVTVVVLTVLVFRTRRRLRFYRLRHCEVCVLQSWLRAASMVVGSCRHISIGLWLSITSSRVRGLISCEVLGI